MNKDTRTDKKACAIVITTDLDTLKSGVKNRADKIVTACKPITDVWYPKFSKAVKKGTDEVVKTWNDYHHTFFPTIDHPADEILRYTALSMILSSLLTDTLDPKTGVEAETRTVIRLLKKEEINQVKYWYPDSRFGDESELFFYANDIDTLSLAYPNA